MPEFYRLSKTNLIAAYTYPFGLRNGYIYDHDAIAHWLQSITVRDVSLEWTPEEKSRWVNLAAATAIGAATTKQGAVDGLGDSEMSAKALAANRSDLSEFVDNLLASPPICELVPIQPDRLVVVLPGGQVIVVPILPTPPTPQPNWGKAEEIPGLDVMAVGAQFQTAAEALERGPLSKDLSALADRLVDVGVLRLSH